MPALRDSSWALESVTTDAGLTIPAPALATNDLLLCIIMADTGTPTWTPPAGWTQIFATTNTCHLAAFWKIATGSEPATYTFGSNVNETYNGAILSIEDVDTTTPINVQNSAAQAAAAKYVFQAVTTTRDNCLVIYAAANSGTGVPSILEGAVQGFLGADGTAESLGLGWGFRAVAGATATPTCSNVATGAGVKGVIAINPPATGAIVIPTYTAADLSIYVNPLNGVTAFNGDTAFAATADTGFSTSLGGRTAGDASVAAATDVGLNSFHSVARMTSISASQNLAGAELVLAAGNRPNVTGKNVLLHVGPSTEGQLQRFSTIASGRGIWFGMRSAAASNWKIWQVYGAELGPGRHQPVVINESAGNTKSTNGTFNPASVFAFGVWISGTGVSTTIWDVAQLWILDTVTVCGGNAAFPVSIEGIVKAVADGHERKSALRQGASQMLSYQPIQFGAGSSTTPVYLDLDSTAIEFPAQYNAATKRVTYNSVDNVVGITYYASAVDTINHTNSVVSSPSPFHWRIHASSSVSATYDFSGLQIIGAGDVVLRDLNTPFSNMSFSRCGMVQSNNAEIESCTFSRSVAAVSLSASSLGKITNCTFISDSSNHAVDLGTVAATTSMSWNNFLTGYASSNGSTGNEAILVNVSGGQTLTINVASGASIPSVRNTGAGSVNVVSGQVTLTVAAVDILTGSPIQNARVYVTAAAGGSLPVGTVLIDKVLTNASGQVTDTRSYSSNQPIVGVVRKASSGTFYKSTPLAGTVSNTSGLSLTVQMIPDQ